MTNILFPDSMFPERKQVLRQLEELGLIGDSASKPKLLRKNVRVAYLMGGGVVCYWQSPEHVKPADVVVEMSDRDWDRLVAHCLIEETKGGGLENKLWIFDKDEWFVRDVFAAVFK